MALLKIARPAPHLPEKDELPEVLLAEALRLATASPAKVIPTLRATRRRTITRRGVLWLGQTCNLRCHFCYFLDRIEDESHPEHAFMSLDKAKAICTTLATTYGNNAIDIQGGEPTIWPHIHDLVSHCASIRLAPTLITNALVLDRRDRVERYRDSGLRDFLISVQGLGRAHDVVVGVENAHRKQMVAIDHMRAVGVPFRFNCVMTQAALPQLPSIARLAVETGARVVNFLAFNPFADQRQAGVRTTHNVPRYSDVSGPLNEALDILAAAHLEANVRYIPFCMVAERHWPSVYNYQQLSYDTHEWDFASWTWTNKAPQRMAPGALSPAVPLASRPRLGRLRKPLMALASRLRLRDRMLAVDQHPIYGPWFRRLDGLGYRLFRQRDLTAAYRADAQNRVEHNAYKKSAACQSCALSSICDGFHGDYADLLGMQETVPVHGRPLLDDPTTFVSLQDKLIEPEDHSWAL